MVFADMTPMAVKAKNSGNKIAESSIIECMRELHLFVNKTHESLYGSSVGKAVLLNQSLSNSNKSLDNSFIKNSNSLIMILNLYVFDVEFYGNSDNYINSYFKLINAFSNSETLDYNNNTNHYNGQSMYSDYENVNEVLIDSELANIIIPKPKWYTNTHANNHNDLDAPLNEYSSNDLTFYGYELVDRHRTYVYRHDLSEWELFIKSYMGDTNLFKDNTYVDGKSLDLFNPTSISDDMFAITSNNLIEGVAFAYDTNGKFKNNKNPDGKTSVYSIPNMQITAPFAKMQFKEVLNNRVKNMLDQIDLIAGSIESVYGNIDLFYVPRKYGDKIKIKFNDYNENNQPLDSYRDLEKVLKGDTINSIIYDYLIKDEAYFNDIK